MRHLVLVALCAAACAKGDRGPTADSPATSTDVRDGYTREKLYDATGDGRPEKFVVRMTGTRPDSLDVVLTILDPSGTELYADRWNTRDYYLMGCCARLKPDSLPPAERDSILRANVDAVLADKAFGPFEGDPHLSRDAVRWDLAAHEYRKANGLAPHDTIPAAAADRIRKAAERVDSARVDAVIEEARRAGRSFDYFLGGETSTTIAWSAKEGRFVVVFACC